MIDIFWWFISILVFVCVLGLLLTFYRLWLGDKYLTAQKKLSVQMANLRRDYPELAPNREEFVENSLGSLGIEGVIASLIPKQYKAFTPIIVPIASGFIDSYMKNPAKLQDLANKLGVKLPDVSQTGNSTAGFTAQM